MAKRPEGVPFFVGGMAAREQIWQTLEGLYNLGITEFRIIAPPPPVAANGGATAVPLLERQRRQRHDGGVTGIEAIRRLASKGEPFAFKDAAAAKVAAGLVGMPSGDLKKLTELGEISRTGSGAYAAAGGAAVDAPQRETARQIVYGMLREAYPKPVPAAALRAQIVARGHTPNNGNVALNAMKSKHLVRRVGAGKWACTPKGAKQ